jgi:AcrR family transcriptional regulator
MPRDTPRIEAVSTVHGAGRVDRTRDAIVAAAAEAMAEHGAHASVVDIARRAGVARATVYRYFPRREELIAELSRRSLAECGELIADAHLDAIPVDDAIARAARALVGVGTRYRILLQAGIEPEPALIERLVRDPVRRVIARGCADGTLRCDIAPARLYECFASLVVGVAERGDSRRFGVEDASATVVELFLNGARPRADAASG